MAGKSKNHLQQATRKFTRFSPPAFVAAFGRKPPSGFPHFPGSRSQSSRFENGSISKSDLLR
jgi:hypothetical protein